MHTCSLVRINHHCALRPISFLAHPRYSPNSEPLRSTYPWIDGLTTPSAMAVRWPMADDRWQMTDDSKDPFPNLMLVIPLPQACVSMDEPGGALDWTLRRRQSPYSTSRHNWLSLLYTRSLLRSKSTASNNNNELYLAFCGRHLLRQAAAASVLPEPRYN
ncbi:hypothetical protein BDW02DRAFT_420753 [Decorospora gaudefroyi]|uniref:Uncharacterized protein n=1 Tax=Decorospora gaudefroyi TaxID=184978 RepID=A0A6A5K7C0_9PLEO|nr:hypothetical protein BDW02DRAFT_420753 [Decorospora gaudefroyi]